MPKKPKNPSIHLGKRLAEQRKAAGITQVQLAEATGMSQRMISYYEKTEDHPLAKLLRHFATALDVSADELLGLDSPEERKHPRKPKRSATD